MLDEVVPEERGYNLARIAIVLSIVAGLLAAAVLVVHSRSWASLLGACLLAFVVGPVVGLVVDAGGRWFARALTGGALRSPFVATPNPTDGHNPAVR